LNLAENYENCAKEAEEYSKALLTGDKATIEAAQSALEAAVEIGELAEKYDLNSEELEDYAKRLKELHKNSDISLKDATKLAVANMRLDRGMSNLNDNLKDYKKALSETNRGSAEWSSTLSDLKTDLADMFNIADGSMLSDKFAEATLNSNDLKLALDGNVDALLRLRLAAADDIIANLEIDDSALANV
jgi:chromosome segregation ATPase